MRTAETLATSQGERRQGQRGDTEMGSAQNGEGANSTVLTHNHKDKNEKKLGLFSSVVNLISRGC